MFNTKINIASKIIFKTQPTTIIVAESFGLPSPLIVLLKINPIKLNTAPSKTTLIYAFAYTKLSALAPNN